MRYLIVALLFLISCQEEKIDDMIVSKSLPIEFYIDGELSYRQDSTPGVYQPCFCHMINYEDITPIQVQHTTGQTLTLDAYLDGNMVQSSPFTEIATGVYQVNFIPTLAMVGKKVLLLVTDDSSEIQLLSNPSFATDLSSWTATGWTQDSGNAVYEFSSALQSGEISQVITAQDSGYYRVKFDWLFNDYGEGSYPLTYKVIFLNGSTEVESFEFTTSVVPSSTVSFDEVYFIESSFTTVKLYLEFTSTLPSAGGSPTVVPLASLDNWVDEGADWTVDADPNTTLVANQSASDFRSPYSTITEAEYGNLRTLTVDFDVEVESAASPSRAELDFASFNVLSNYSEKTFDGYGTVSTGASPFIIIDEDTDGLGVYSDGLASGSGTEITSADYGDVKEVDISFTGDGTDGLVTMSVSLYNNNSLVQTDTYQFDMDDANLGLSHTFEFNTSSSIDQIVIRIRKDTLEAFSANKITFDSIAMYHYETFSYVNLDAELRLNSGAITGGTAATYQVTAGGNYQAVFNYEVAGDMNNVALQFANGPGGLDATITINSVVLTSILNTPDINLEFFELYSVPVLAESECVEVQNNHTMGLLIEYSNNTDFDNISYSASPSPTFSIRIPAQFWKEQYPKEFENYAKSNDEWQSVYSQMQEKRLLEIGHVPYFMHKKINRILMHNNILIDGEYWICQDEYENEAINRYAKSKAQVWLTKKDGITRNVL